MHYRCRRIVLIPQPLYSQGLHPARADCVGGIVEKYAGALPTWLMPEQVRVLPISDRLIDDAKKVEEQLSRAGIRVSCDTRSEKVGYKIREAQLEKIPYMLVIGDKEVDEGTVSVRSRKEGDLGSMPVESFLSKVLQEIATKAK